jgi:hypothetical protein
LSVYEGVGVGSFVYRIHSPDFIQSPWKFKIFDHAEVILSPHVVLKNYCKHSTWKEVAVNSIMALSQKEWIE